MPIPTCTPKRIARAGYLRFAVPSSLLVSLISLAAAEERVARFDADPGWDGVNNRSNNLSPRTVRQDFGFSETSHAGRERGEVGGFIMPAAEPAYYARRMERKTFNDELSASGALACDGQEFHVLLGFFNSRSLNEWRTPNTVAIRLLGRGDVFYAFVEYATARWRAGGDSPGGFATVLDPATGRTNLRGFPARGAAHTWSLRYDPAGNGGAGVVTATVDGETAVCNLDPGHRADGAELDRFGLLNVLKSADGGGEVWLDDVTILGEAELFDRDPQWDALGNRRSFVSANVRPRFDFGFSPTRYAGGLGAGEIGGLVFRGDCRYPERLASFGDRLETLSLEKPLRASGRVCLRRGVSDSTTLFGFYNSSESTKTTPSQAWSVPASFLGVAIEGPSSRGFLFYPVYRAGADAGGRPEVTSPPIYPDGASRSFTLVYSPDEAGGRGSIAVTLDGHTTRLDLREGEKAGSARFDRFGLVTTWIDGNAQEVYLDDLSYTASQ